MKLKCSVCEFVFKDGDDGCLMETLEYEGGKKETYFYHLACHKVQEDFGKLREEKAAQGEEIPAFYDYCREQGIKINPKIFEWRKKWKT